MQKASAKSSLAQFNRLWKLLIVKESLSHNDAISYAYVSIRDLNECATHLYLHKARHNDVDLIP
jgi:hypothetical protein